MPSYIFFLFFYPFFFIRPIYYPRITVGLAASSSSGPGSHTGPSSPLPTTVRTFIFITGTIQYLLPSSTRSCRIMPACKPFHTLCFFTPFFSSFSLFLLTERLFHFTTLLSSAETVRSRARNQPPGVQHQQNLSPKSGGIVAHAILLSS